MCFEARSASTGRCPGLAMAASVHCVRLVVLRCRYALQKDEQLQEIASLFNVDWMRIWSLNANMVRPSCV